MKTKILYFLFSAIIFLCASHPSFADEKASGSSATFADITTVTQSQDSRAKVLKIYLDQHNSPLAEYADFFVQQADINHIPWTLVPAIAGTESTFGQQVPWETCNNAWGYGIYGSQTLCFPSYREAIKTISKAIREQYMDKWGATDVYDIGRFYAASPTWADHTLFFMNQIQELQMQLTMQSLPISL